jgi:hypothetical protein
LNEKSDYVHIYYLASRKSLLKLGHNNELIEKSQ